MAKKILKKPDALYDVFERKPGVDKTMTHYCPGCGHGILHKLIAEAIDDLGVADRTIFVSPVGCSVFAYYYFDVGNVQVAHGRAPAVATGLKRASPNSIVISYQGDGDLAAIGGNNILQAANRGELFTVFFINNGIYGMTGGQMAPTTLIGQKTTTTPYGRTIRNEGYPIRVCELLATLESPVYIERTAMTDAKNIARTRRAVRKALRCQVDRKGFSLVEVLSSCPSGWKVEPREALKWIEEKMMPYFPLGVYKDVIEEREPVELVERTYTSADIMKGLALADGEAAARAPRHEDVGEMAMKIAGFGGQGILFLGLALAETGMDEGLHVTWLPSYGPEMRGGTANCHVILSGRRVGAPLVSIPNVLIALNRPSLEKFEPALSEGGLILYDSSLIDISPSRKDIIPLPVPATKLADELGSTRAANMVAMGALIGYTDVVSVDGAIAALPRLVKRDELISLNEAAIRKGVEQGRQLRAKQKVAVGTGKGAR
ncbi:MAG: 2-ketoisovalerate ferredoxin oxidoreductase [Latescibacteria bacterium DG_63]|uniref:2-ketoisovalerate ferredoxin oxidoreductase n=2 Tax=Bacteria division TA06 TaxID=1156500 RepID=A0A0S8JMN5_UNCT6|nr:MAG: 2-ketoisovalerate ferredoxin oxidoreductase [Latescibacteria bacterium DG_63]KPK69531.1 MAG: 2-ketoisovalerate ferredoxin oxidoreductase [candidate division TA06 bacterium SM23_40]KPL10784.1 MAG: 2-ketoisovalerate ferredoxin oxidoreductase [candidate division TA06 bacterium SM1_40]